MLFPPHWSFLTDGHHLIADRTISHFLSHIFLPPFSGLHCLFVRSRKDSLESESSAAIVPHELVRTRQLESVHLKFNQESGTLLPLCLRYGSPPPTHTQYLPCWNFNCLWDSWIKENSPNFCVKRVWQNVLIKHQNKNTNETSFSHDHKGLLQVHNEADLCPYAPWCYFNSIRCLK